MVKPRVTHKLGKCSIAELHTQPNILFFFKKKHSTFFNTDFLEIKITLFKLKQVSRIEKFEANLVYYTVRLLSPKRAMAYKLI